MEEESPRTMEEAVAAVLEAAASPATVARNLSVIRSKIVGAAPRNQSPLMASSWYSRSLPAAKKQRTTTAMAGPGAMEMASTELGI